MRTHTPKVLAGIALCSLLAGGATAEASTLVADTGLSFGNHDYQAVSADTWYGAYLAAQAAGGHLVTINSAAENQFIFESYTNYSNPNDAPSLWIGYTDSTTFGTTEGHFVWVDGEPTTYTNWFTGEPNNNGIGTENATAMLAGSFYQGAWNDFASDTGDGRNTPYRYRGVVEWNAATHGFPTAPGVPEPGAVALALVGGLAIARGRARR